MTAPSQAGAVAYREWHERDIDKDGCHIETMLWELGPGQAVPSKGAGVLLVEPLYAAPPAAVPVEALEGLVAGLNDSIAHNDESEDWLRGAKTTAAFIRDELTQLIKERSNG